MVKACWYEPKAFLDHQETSFLNTGILHSGISQLSVMSIIKWSGQVSDYFLVDQKREKEERSGGEKEKGGNEAEEASLDDRDKLNSVSNLHRSSNV